MDSEKARQRAEETFKQDQSARYGRQAQTEYEKRAIAIRESAARLKALRLAMEAQVQNSERDK
jgi:hypothetical protein